MLIEEMVLSGYKRLLLNNIKEFIYKPTSQYQLILGTNGSGKSSILHEASPLPAIPANYVSGGSKLIVISHRGSHYELTSTFKGSTGKHTFVKDGLVMNDNGTASVQKELVEQEFGYTAELHSLLIGQTLFTDMGPGKRRDWITRISDIDLDYAMRMYDRLKGTVRDMSGALKHVSGRLTQETNKLAAFSDIDELEQESEQLKAELNVLLAHFNPKLPPLGNVQQRIDEIINHIELVSMEIVNLDIKQPDGVCVESYEELDTHIRQIEQDIQQHDHHLKRLYKEHDDVARFLNALRESGSGSLSELKDKEKALYHEIKQLEDSIVKFRVLNDTKGIIESNREALPQLVEILQQIPNNESGYYSRKQLEMSRTEKEQVNKELDRTLAHLSRVEGRIETIQSSKDTSCPKCSYRWKEGVSETELAELKVQADALRESVNELRTRVGKSDRDIETLKDYAEIYGRFGRLAGSYPRLRTLWDYMLENQCVTHNPAGHIEVVYCWERDMDVCHRLEMLVKEDVQLKEAIQHAESLESGDSRFANGRIGELEKEIERTIVEKELLQRDYPAIDAYRRRLDGLKRLVIQNNTLLKSLSEALEDHADALRNDGITTLTKRHQTRLAYAHARIGEKATLSGIVTDLEKSHEELKNDHLAGKLLLDILSPVDGLIAEQIRGFIDCMVAQMNDIIKQVWTYDLTILPCGLDSGELDYKFPLSVKSTDSTTPDVQHGSTAQVEIVNFAFKLMVILYLNLQDYPLYLDELGHSFDEQHRINVMNYVKLLIEAKRHSQLFMVNHYAAQWGVFSDAEICVLDTTNVTVPQIHNKHVTIN